MSNYVFLSVLLVVTKSHILFQPTTCLLQQQNQMIYFIRHAQSKFNLCAEELEAKYGHEEFADSEQYTKEKFSHHYLDVQITEKGIEQSKEAREKMKDVEVDVVIVSPMRRALRTCHIIFEGHKSKAKVVVEPAFREIMESSNDIGSKIEQSMQFFPEFDFSNVKDKQAWYVSTLFYPEDRQTILKKLEGLQGKARSQRAVEETMNMMKENWFERRKHHKDAAKQQKLKERVIADFREQSKVLAEYFKKYNKIAIVAHSECIKHYAGYKINNCEIFEMSQSSLPKVEL